LGRQEPSPTMTERSLALCGWVTRISNAVELGFLQLGIVG
jgi:hypothetical protein